MWNGTVAEAKPVFLWVSFLKKPLKCLLIDDEFGMTA
jgi:hypothetical protein